MSEQPPVNDNQEPEGGAPLYLVIVGVIVAAVLLAWFALEFADWNKEQSCALSGRRNCSSTSTTR